MESLEICNIGLMLNLFELEVQYCSSLVGLSISRILAIRIFGLAISEYSVILVWLGCG